MEDIVDFSPSGPAGGAARLAILIALTAAIAVGVYTAVDRAVPPPRTVATPAPTHPVTPAPVVIRPPSTPPALALSPGTRAVALAAIPARANVVNSDSMEVFGNGTGPVGFAAIVERGRYVVDLICLGYGAVSVTLGDEVIFLDESIQSPAPPTARLLCTNEPGAPLPAEVSVAGASLAMKLDPDPGTAAGVAWRIRPV